MTHLLFAYGTLRRGFANHRAFLAGAPCLGRARTRDAFALHVGPDAIPYLAERPARYPVVGELFAVDAARLAAIDRLEGHPDWYARRPLAVVLLDGEAAGAERTAWAYLCPAPVGPVAPTGDYAEALGALGALGTLGASDDPPAPPDARPAAR